jgi:hypothetical protein
MCKQEEEEQNRTRKGIIISPSSCPKSTSLLIDLGAWSLSNLSNLSRCSMKAHRAVWAPCASRRECRPCIWPCRSWKENLLVNFHTTNNAKANLPAITSHRHPQIRGLPIQSGRLLHIFLTANALRVTVSGFCKRIAIAPTTSNLITI